MSSKESNVELLNRFNLPVISNLQDLSYKLLLSDGLLFNLSMFPEYYYRKLRIPKRNKEIREIFSPKSSLRVIQSWILVNILEKLPISSAAMGFRKGIEFGIKPNAYYHKDNRYILKMDIKDFFPSITRRKVYPIFKELGYSQFISNVFTNYCLYNNFLPQGASTSPYISNIILKNVDYKIIEICNNKDILYSRYADDLIFSCNIRSNLQELIHEITSILEQEGLKVNEAKTKIMSPTCRQIITGLVVNNNVVRIKRTTRHNMRSVIFNDIIKGNGELSRKAIGLLSFIKYIEPETYKKLQEYTAKLNLKKGKLSVAVTKKLNDD